MAASSIVALSEMVAEDRFDSEYFAPVNIATARRLVAMGAVPLGKNCDVSNGRTPPEYTEGGDSWVVRSGDLVRPLVSRAFGQAFLRADMSANGVSLSRGDVLISSIGAGSIGKIGLVTDPADLVTVSEVTIVRSSRYTPEFLFAYLSSWAGQNQLNRQVSGATGQQHLIKSRAEMILVPPPPPKRS